MEQLLFHPKVVHLPMALAVLTPLVSAGLLVAWSTGALPRRAWVIAVVLQAALVAGGVVALRSGEAEEERVERVVTKDLIEAHEETAETFVWGAGAVLVLHLTAAVLRRDALARAAAAAATAGTVLVLLFGYRTGETGGGLVYRHGAASAYATPRIPMATADPATDDDGRE